MIGIIIGIVVCYLIGGWMGKWGSGDNS